MVICKKKGCKREVENYKTKSGKPPTLCEHHYKIQRRNEEKRKQKAKEEKKDENTCRIQNCKKNIDISVGDVRQGRVLCSMCGYSNAIVFFLKHSTKVR